MDFLSLIQELTMNDIFRLIGAMLLCWCGGVFCNLIHYRKKLLFSFGAVILMFSCILGGTLIIKPVLSKANDVISFLTYTSVIAGVIIGLLKKIPERD